MLGDLPWRRKRVERELDDELRFHLEREVEKLVQRGMTPEAAMRQARIALGGLDSTKEQVRDTRPARWLEDAASDISYALRSLRRSPAFAVAAILTIALGLGVNAAVFQLVHAVLLEPLPYRAPQQLVHIAETQPLFPVYQTAAPDFFDWRRMSTSFDGLAAHTFQEMNKWVIRGDGEAEEVQVVQASANLFPMLGAQPIVGRFYTEEEERGKSAVVVLSEGLWKRKYHADRSIVGRQIRLVDWPVTVVGVVSQQQAQPNWGEVWMPLTFLDPALTETRRFHALEVVGRLKPGVTVAAADSEMRGIAERLALAHPETNRAIGASVSPMSSWLTGGMRPALLIAWAAVSLVLLLACANVAHLVLVRAVHRSREMGLRLALGAGTSRLARFLLAESSLVSIAGGLLGAVLAHLLLPWLVEHFDHLEATRIAPVTLAFDAASTLACAVLCAWPAVRFARRLDPQQVILQSRGASLSHRRSLFGPVILAAQVALAFVVLTSAGLLYRSYATLLNEPLGFDASNVLAVEVPLALDWERSAKIFEQKVAPRISSIAGVRDVAASNFVPMTLSPTEISRFTTRFGVPGQPLTEEGYPLAQLRWTTPAYFRALTVPLLRGRLFIDADIGKPGCLINEALARQYFPGQDPVGQHLMRNVGGPKPEPATILGVVGNVRDLALDVEPQPAIYEIGISNRVTLLIRTMVSPAALIQPVRSVLREINPDRALRNLAPLENLIAWSLARRRFGLELLGIFAALAAILTAVGVYGVVSYALSHRAHEFAIRRALGADGGQLAVLVLKRFALPTLAGLSAGAVLAAIFAGVLKTQLYKMPASDPVTLIATGAGLLALIAGAALRPAIAAASVSLKSIPRE